MAEPDRAPGLVTALRAALAGDVQADVPLAPRTTLKVGGPAAALATAESVDDLVAVSRVCTERGVPWLILGRGSNLLVADAGWPGVVVELGRAFRGVRVDGARVEAGGAEPMAALAAAVAKHGLGGMAFGIAIPGAVGGAVRMNAGAHGGQMRDVLEWVDVVRLGLGGARERIAADALNMRYRHTDLPADAVVITAGLLLRPTAADRLEEEMAEMRQWRRDHQPLNEPSCGSVFRNPEGDSAGRLIDTAGMKEHRVGGARVSPKHANFITVDRAGTAADVRRVILDVQEAVRRRHDVSLVPEVVIVGFDDADEADGADDAGQPTAPVGEGSP
jgi:UDP-N-acetylmuramate dehydrogenase